MNFIQSLLRRIEYGNYTPVIKYGQIYAETIGKEKFTLSPQLLQGKTDWALRLDLNRRWGSTGDRTLIDLYFVTLEDLKDPIQQLLQDVNSQITDSNLTRKQALFEKIVMKAGFGPLLRSYGRIDHHPKNEGRFSVELFLSKGTHQYWMILCQGEGSVEWSKWPIGVANALNTLFPKIETQLRKPPDS